MMTSEPTLYSDDDVDTMEATGYDFTICAQCETEVPIQEHHSKQAVIDGTVLCPFCDGTF